MAKGFGSDTNFKQKSTRCDQLIARMRQERISISQDLDHRLIPSCQRHKEDESTLNTESLQKFDLFANITDKTLIIVLQYNTDTH